MAYWRIGRSWDNKDPFALDGQMDAVKLKARLSRDLHRRMQDDYPDDIPDIDEYVSDAEEEFVGVKESHEEGEGGASAIRTTSPGEGEGGREVEGVLDE